MGNETETNRIIKKVFVKYHDISSTSSDILQNELDFLKYTDDIIRDIKNELRRKKINKLLNNGKL